MPSYPRPLASLRGRPFALPAPLDDAVERWWALPPRARLAIGLSVTLAMLLVAGRGAARSPWGEPVPVLVAARDLPAGAELTPSEVVLVERPEATLPVGALAEVPTGRLSTMIPQGAVLTSAHVTDHGLAAGLAPGRSAVALPAADLPTLSPGQRIDVVTSTTDGSGARLATDAVVLATGGDHIWLDVARDEAVAIGAGLGWARVTVVLLPPEGHEGSAPTIAPDDASVPRP